MKKLIRFIFITISVLMGNITASYLFVNIIKVELFDNNLVIFILSLTVFVNFLLSTYFLWLSLRLLRLNLICKNDKLFVIFFKSLLFSIVLIALMEYTGDFILSENYIVLTINFVLVSYVIRLLEEMFHCYVIRREKDIEK